MSVSITFFETVHAYTGLGCIAKRDSMSIMIHPMRKYVKPCTRRVCYHLANLLQKIIASTENIIKSFFIESSK